MHSSTPSPAMDDFERSDPPPSPTVVPNRFQELSRLLHEVGVAYGKHDIRAVRETFRQIVSCCDGSTTPMSRWYYGFAQYGIASTSARLSDTSQARVAILASLQSDYWSTDVIRSDEVLRQVVGGLWLDSVAKCYETLRVLSASSWPAQSPVLILPHCAVTESPSTQTAPASSIVPRQRRLISWDSLTPRLRDSMKVRRPLILALHGGNASYREFALHWKAVADSLNVAVLIPPGDVRFSADDNSWDDSYHVCDEYLTGVIDRYAEACGYEPELYIAGFSQGAKTGIKYGLVHAGRVRGVIAVAGLFDDPLPRELVANSAQAGLRIYAMSGEYETQGFLHTMMEVQSACDAGKLPFRFETVPNMAHEVPAELVQRLRAAWPWLRRPNAAQDDAEHTQAAGN